MLISEEHIEKLYRLLENVVSETMQKRMGDPEYSIEEGTEGDIEL